MQSALELAQEMNTNPVVLEVLRTLEEDKGKMADVAYLPGLSVGMIEAGNLFDYFAALLLNGKVEILAVNGSDGSGVMNPKPGGAWPGKDWYMKELTARGVPEEKILPLHGPQGHSREETDALLEEAQLQRWRSIIVVSVDYHRPRQVLGCIAKMIQMNFRTDLYFPSIPFDWDKEMLGSQSVAVSTGRKEADTDWNRKVPKYQAEGHLASIEDFREYMALRNFEHV
jgi:hypothetical protein